MNSKKNLKRNLLICLLAGSAVMYTLPLHAATSVIGNGTLPSGGEVMAGQIDIPDWARPGGTNPAGNLEMNIIQNSHNGVIKWDSFDIGGSATVNFRGPQDFNTLNYVNSGAASQIYGTINANNNGNIFIVNPAGVQIGNSAQINVGSLYVSNKKFSDDKLKKVKADTNVNDFMQGGTLTNAELMSLGNINITNIENGNVTFEGNGRIVIDTERIKKNDVVTDNFIVKTDDINDVLLGYDAYNTENNPGTYDGMQKTFANNVFVNNSATATAVDGYMWVEDVKQLQAINTNLNGNYALRNSIDATATSSWDDNDNDNINEGFKQIGTEIKNAFTGKFDGLDYNIFGLTINRSTENDVGLFGVVNGATINNVTLVGGSITGNYRVGGIVGNAIGENTVISNATNSASVTGNSQVGGIVGIITGNSVNKSKVNNVINTGTINGNAGNDVGGLIGSLNNSQLIGNSYNLGAVTSSGHDVGGLVGSALNSTIGDGTNLVYNRLDVTGAYNVGGIVGNMEVSTVKNAENSGTVLATWYITEGYTYHTGESNSGNLPSGNLNGDGTATTTVNVANVGGIAGISSNSTITNVENNGDVSTETIGDSGDNSHIYRAGNVGGVVGSAVNTNITNATNKENSVRGAHNVGGIAGYFSGKGTIDKGINDGGDIMATGARYDGNFVRETVRPITGDANESFIIGNIGGIVGYMEGNGAKVTGSANRGTVHTDEPGDPTNVKDWQKAANVGGIVGKIDRRTTGNLKNDNNEIDVTKAAVSNSYNTGDVLGYTGVGGVAGMMYNGEIAASYNLGYLRTTRQSQQGSSIDALNMGGIVGDTTELSGAEVYLYDVYNKGQIGDSKFNYFGRHVGGIVGRLSGTVEKAYNNGAIYNGYNVVGGIAGWMAQGKIENAFNTGNITVLNKNNASSQVGGIAGAASDNSDIVINNAYNLGTLRSFKDSNVANAGNNTLGGILGHIQDENQGNARVTITNVYTTGNLFIDEGNGIGSIYGSNTIGDRLYFSNTYYIRPQEDEVGNPLFTELSGNSDNSNKAIDFDEKSDLKQYHYYDNDGTHHSLTFTQQEGGKIYGSVEGITTADGKLQQIESTDTDTGAWRIYYGNTPILNAFLPDSEKYFAKNGLTDNSNNTDKTFNGSIQYGTAYDPLLTIINTDRDLVFNFGTKDNELSITNAAGLAVYGGGVTLNNFTTSSGSGYFGGTIYADGALNINGVKNDIGIGSAADIYGSAVNITTDGKVTIYGDVTATGNTANGATSDKSDVIDVKDKGNITISASDVDVYGTLTSAEQGSSVVVSGIEDQAVQGWKPGLDIGDEEEVMSDIADRFAHTTGASDVDGNITIIAKTKLVVDDNDEPILDENGNKQYIGGGNVNLYYGNKEQGLITTGGNLTVTGTGDVYVDSDLSIGGGLSLTAGADKEIVLDISNIGQVQNNHDNTEAVKTLHDFLGQFGEKNAIKINGTDDAKITVDMWQGDAFDLDKFDIDNNNTFAGALTDLKVNVNDADTNSSGRDITHIWVSSGEQLKNIQTYYKTETEEGRTTGILGYNFALKNDINASDVSGYEAIGTNSANGFTGTFDGRGNRIIGLKVENANGNAGIFDTIGTNGVVKDVNIYSGTFTGSKNAGAVAGVNSGRIEGIVTFGNTVTSKGNAGGIVGVNNSGNFSKNETTGSTNDGVLTNGIYDVESTGSVIAGSSSAIAGGLVGKNDGGLANSFSDSAVTVDTNVTSGTSVGLGGVVGVNTEKGNVQYVDSLGVTNGGATGSSNIGGIIGTNNGNMYSGYNESIVSGKDNVGGIIGENDGGINYTVEEDRTVTWSKGTVENVVNATGVTGTGNNVGGLLGTNIGSVENGRNNGTIAGNEYVGGLVGNNASKNSVLTNLVNDSSAAITGERYVGGIAGSNAGTITTGNEETDETVNLINRGTITGQQYVGGVAGSNSGTITNANNDVELNVKDSTADAEFFGGIAGENTKDGIIKNATNTADVNADGATYVGGIVGKNDGTLENMAGNSGNVTGENYVGGVAGLNTNNKPLNGVEASNTGTVFATAGGAGGIFAVNNANITNSKLTNNGTVIGNSGNGTGGIFGVNTGNISTSSLINEVDGQVIGTNNVGGLIGKNTGTITGGRDDADSYYKYQIYNNGVINVGAYIYNSKNGEYEFKVDTGSNIGGLIGDNQGSLTAGYNTGAINAADSENVGGIAGSNSGTIDQVFNTVMTENGQNQTITGDANVGGLVGNNSGTLSNAYNTTREVKGDAVSTGNLVGINGGTVQYVYGVANNLIGSGTDAVNGYVIDNSDQWKQEGSYDGFTGANGWKIYNGSTLPMLSVFLTKVTVVDQHLVNQYFSAKHYGELHQITADDIKALIAIGAISAPDGFGAFNNNNGLIQGVADDAMANSGNWLYSQQILGSNINGLFNPNNLGYDISLVYSPFELDNDPSSHWNYLFNDAPFDRNKDFRERKAEVNFVDGGMEI
ncbi:hypothetical protein M3079_05920 [Phascolarctobacterium sp. ET69]|uniref:hypothetical protein n=1 Tax=Phascolarctobacterium sp. ET69 TaxID=2939420 RepID=UPI0020137A65|nr:hypothetical protein [Phascolarctobacterium sp. ET69]MCL1605517.1 hypothetical protein [Phascolarctobacterium sp. ET69]